MEQREIEFISDRLYRGTLENKRSGGWTQNDLLMEQEMYKELAELGFHFNWHMQLSYKEFTTKDKAVIPIFKKYYDAFDAVFLKEVCALSLGVKGFYDATEFLLERTKQADGVAILDNTIYYSIYRIKNPYCVDKYIEMLSDHEKLVSKRHWLLSLLGILRARKAIPCILDLIELDYKTTELAGNNVFKTTGLEALGRFKDPAFRPIFEKYLTYPAPAVREMSQKCLAKLDK